mgnify:CR=1 FL=1
MNSVRLKVEIHHVFVLTVDVVGTGDDSFFEATEVVAPCPIAAIRIEVVRAANEFVRALFTRVDDVHVAVGPGHFAVTPEALGIIEGHGAFGFTEIACAQKEHGTQWEEGTIHFHTICSPNLQS